jgi:type 1 fimbria pilin
VGLNKDGTIRLYANRSDANGNELTISVAEGYTIKSIKITFGGADYAANCEISANGAVITTSNGESLTCEVEINAGSFVLKNVQSGGSKNVAVYISSIEIVYTAPATNA